MEKIKNLFLKYFQRCTWLNICFFQKYTLVQIPTPPPPLNFNKLNYILMTIHWKNTFKHMIYKKKNNYV
jgi:hypothetical protein